MCLTTVRESCDKIPLEKENVVTMEPKYRTESQSVLYVIKCLCCVFIFEMSSCLLHIYIYIYIYIYTHTHTYIRRSQWPGGLRRRSAAARLLRSWVRIPPGAWMFVVSVVCCQVEVFATS